MTRAGRVVARERGEIRTWHAGVPLRGEFDDSLGDELTLEPVLVEVYTYGSGPLVVATRVDRSELCVDSERQASRLGIEYERFWGQTYDGAGRRLGRTRAS